MADSIKSKIKVKDKTKTALKVAITLILIALSVYFTLKDTEPDKLWDALTAANYLWVLLSFPVILLSHYLRAVRWKIMLKPIIKVKSVANLFKTVMIGYAANAVTPRGGELLRPYVYARKENVSFSSVFGTIIVERFLDLLTLLFLFLVSLIIFWDRIIYALDVVFKKLQEETNVTIDAENFLFIFLIIVVVILVSFFPPVIRFFLRKIVKPVSKKYFEKLMNIFEKFQHGFAIIKDPTEYLRIAFYSLLIWFCYGIPNYLMFYAVGFDLGIGDAFLLLIVVGVAVTIAPTPGALGVHHVAVRLAMVILYGANEQDAVAYAILTHAMNYVLSIALGGYYYLRNKSIIPENTDISNEVEEAGEQLARDSGSKTNA